MPSIPRRAFGSGLLKWAGSSFALTFTNKSRDVMYVFLTPASDR